MTHVIERSPPTSDGFEKLEATATEATGSVAAHPAARIAAGVCAAKPESGSVVVVGAAGFDELHPAAASTDAMASPSSTASQLRLRRALKVGRGPVIWVDRIGVSGTRATTLRRMPGFAQ
jgi:hypothetical protein